MKNDSISVDRDIGGMVRTATQSHVEVKPTYTPEDCSHLSYEKDLGDPGVYPYTRGIYPEMFRKRLWLKSFIVSYSTAEETNTAFKE
ncbi:MAG: methylmalonyl-CoA mutase family protein, partial [Desulfobacteraceae bacterium]|nr:methylmalonyl-CoA mutase family protein [Desulfobacteraceae bacterium]